MTHILGPSLHFVPAQIETATIGDHRVAEAVRVEIGQAGVRKCLPENLPDSPERIGNMTLFAGELNIGASNDPFVRKRVAYKKSAILLTQELAKMSNFKFKEIDKRSKTLAEKAIELWPRP